MDDDYRTKNKYKIQKGSKKRGRNIYHVSTEYLKDETKPKELNKGGEPIKAVGGILAGMAAGIAPGIIGVGMLAKKAMKKKSSTVSSDDVKYSLKDKNMLTDLYQKSIKQETSKMNKGGGMDMGHKPRPRGNPGVVETVVGKGGDYIKDLIN